jgi:predicted metal-dependent HD superfamily phosphohydrolase
VVWANLDRAQERFEAVWRHCLVDGAADGAAAVFRSLRTRYCEPHRCYHTTDHVGHCLREFDLARGHMDHAAAVELAIWFHDAVYAPEASDNEQRSAELFDACAGDGFDEGSRRHVHDLILVTMHADRPASVDEAFMVDIDLSSFGLPWPDFVRDSDAVRREYAHLPDDQFHARQARFLHSLLARPTIYSTELFRRRHEEAARLNITRRLGELSALAGG